MDNNSVKFKRIFIHELGHLVAHEIDSKIYTNIPPVKAIKIYPCLEDSEELCAEIVRNFPEGLNENTLTPRERVAYSLAGSSHGCIFEAYFLKSSIIKCFENHGEKDQCKFNGELIRLGIFYKIEIFNQIIYDYWNELKNDDILSHFINLDPQNFILEDDSFSSMINKS